ncbi:autotransporter domain-containing protein [Enterobacteriaceae bacterium H11S18]|uniref:autotransporter domain-containing protein n=1 Tax=Dryocola clanedunensis TaxID=2925396 RepID=UPI0022F136E7|nr:autotransporter domain-containing protein [Dryocola clanedunensis]MCT4712199.1 autotransporter domain-containing protein [Dryocola clanedunensis]
MTAAFSSSLTLLFASLTLSPLSFAADGHRIKQRADAVLTLMSYMVFPDVTASDLNIGSGTGETNELTMTQFGGGATMSDAFPVYLEGALGYSRYDPQFVISNGAETRRIPTRWNSLTATGGIGWDFHLYRDSRGGNLVLRPIANVMLGTMASDIRIGAWAIKRRTNADYDFLNGGRLNAWGLGGSLMLDYELISKPQDIDIELRYSSMNLQTFANTSRAVDGHAEAQNLGIYLRRRAPISDWTLLQSPVRYVLEGAHTEYLGDQRGRLGFDSLSSVGLGLELDSSKYPVFITRTRLVARYMFGNNTSGYGVGLAMSF